MIAVIGLLIIVAVVVIGFFCVVGMLFLDGDIGPALLMLAFGVGVAMFVVGACLPRGIGY